MRLYPKHLKPSARLLLVTFRDCERHSSWADGTRQSGIEQEIERDLSIVFACSDIGTIDGHCLGMPWLFQSCSDLFSIWDLGLLKFNCP